MLVILSVQKLSKIRILTMKKEYFYFVTFIFSINDSKSALPKIKFCDLSHERDIMGIVKSIDPGQSTQADHGRNFSLLADFLCIK